MTLGPFFTIKQNKNVSTTKKLSLVECKNVESPKFQITPELIVMNAI